MKPTKTLRKQLFQLTGPIFVETLLIMLLGAMDTFMLSHYSDDTVAAVGVVNQLCYVPSTWGHRNRQTCGRW